MIITYQYKLTLTESQEKKLFSILEEQRQLYNAALQERIDCYQKTGKYITLYDQQKSLTQIRENYCDNVPVNVQRWTLKKVDDSFKSFFRRLKAKTKSGFPRFRNSRRWRSFGFYEFSGIRLINNKLVIKNIGKIKIHLHRSLPSNDIKSCVFTHTVAGWKINLDLQIMDKAKNDISTVVGLDLGLKDLITLSTGENFPNICTKQYTNLLKRKQRKLNRCKLRSKRRVKIRREVARVYYKITNIHNTHFHQISSKLVGNYDLIALEKLQINNMLKNHHLAKSIHNVSWAKLIKMVIYKAERAGKHAILVDPRYTSQTCSHCGHCKKLLLSERTYICDNCEMTMDRDHNAAKNILDKAVVGLELHNVIH